jgi:hypothetical protein
MPTILKQQLAAWSLWRGLGTPAKVAVSIKFQPFDMFHFKKNI